METLMSKPRFKQAHAALCTMVGMNNEDTAISSALNRAWHFTDKAESILCKKDAQATIASLVAGITELAILNADVIHIFCDYSPHINSLFVEVNHGNTVYEDLNGPFFRCTVSLKRGHPIEELKDLEDKLIELIADAKDNAMGAC